MKTDIANEVFNKIIEYGISNGVTKLRNEAAV